MKKVTLAQFQYESRSVPLSAAYLVSGLQRERIDYSLKIYPKCRFKITTKDLYSFLSDSADILAVGCLSHMLPYLIVALKKVKEQFPKKTIILGGIGPTEAAEGIMRKFDFVDFIIKGCAIESLPLLIKKVINNDQDVSDVKRLVYRERGAVKANAYDGFYSEQTVTTVPAYQYITQSNTFDKFDMMTSFGCLYRCTYCYLTPLAKRKVAYRPLEDVAQEIELIRSIKKNERFFLRLTDEAFILNRDRVIAFCRMLKKLKLRLSWNCYGRVDRMDEELIKTLARHGCTGLYYGIESGSDRVLKEAKKGFCIGDAQKILLLSKKYFKYVTASFIYLYPFETVNDFCQTFAMKKYFESKGIKTQLHTITPVKNSEIYRKYKDTLRLYDKAPSTHHGSLKSLPEDCLALVRQDPDIFYFYYTYYFNELEPILSTYRRFKAFYNKRIRKAAEAKSRNAS
ncbi:MAG: radical SAM protein [Candidatus Omnitrophica bacterium]|nr:radical SAM protein [Candidatus Omnitrophota bacterium]